MKIRIASGLKSLPNSFETLPIHLATREIVFPEGGEHLE